MKAKKDTAYLSKSNHSNPDLVSRVRTWLRKKGYTILEHGGGEYNEDLLFEAKVMIMVGVADNTITIPPSDPNNGILKIGKGQYNQLRNRRQRGLNSNMIISNLYFDNPILRSVTCGGVIDKNNWTTHYGQLKVKMDSTFKLYGADKDVVEKQLRPKLVEDEVEANDWDQLPDNWKVIAPKPKVHLAAIALLQGN